MQAQGMHKHKLQADGYTAFYVQDLSESWGTGLGPFSPSLTVLSCLGPT